MPGHRVYLRQQKPMLEAVILSGCRTAIGTFGGALKDVPPVDLGALVVREAAPSVMGSVNHDRRWSPSSGVDGTTSCRP